MGCRSTLTIGSWFVLLNPASPLAWGPQDRALAPTLELEAGRCYVGQTIKGRISVVGGEQPPTLSIGKSDVVDVIPLKGVEIQPQGASGIGEKTRIANLYRFPVRIMARKPGNLTLPSFRVSEDRRSAVVPPRKIVSLPPPPAGRNSAFLGGVGAIETFAEARPEAATLGESVEFRWRLDGPGSIGSNEPPTIPGLAREHWKIESLPPESVVDPPSRTFRFRLKPDRAGNYTLGPILVSTSTRPQARTARPRPKPSPSA